jgi:hypothetical protein
VQAGFISRVCELHRRIADGRERAARQKGRLLKLKDPQPMPPPMAKAKGVRRCMSARCHLRKHYRTRVAR